MDSCWLNRNHEFTGEIMSGFMPAGGVSKDKHLTRPDKYQIGNIRKMALNPDYEDWP
jgi:hypothetical protein